MYEVIVVGGGLAGLTCARDLGHLGRSVLILEARDRLGGRTWYRPFGDTGYMIEMGGTWFAEEWQRNVAAEIERYDVPTVQSPTCTEFRAVLGGQLLTGEQVPVPAEERADLARVMAEIATVASRILFGRQFDDPSLDDLDIEFTGFVDSLRVTPLVREYLYVWAGFAFGCEPHELSTLHALSWVAGYDNSPWTLGHAPATKFAQGTASLVAALVDDSKADIHLSTPVDRISQNPTDVEVTCRTGEKHAARAVVLATPLNTWNDIQFAPILRPGKRLASSERHAGHAGKIWAVATGVPDLLDAFGWGGGLNWISEQGSSANGRLLVGLGCAPGLLDVSSVASIEAAIRQFAPRATVVAAEGHDWVVDEFSKGTWVAFRPSQVSRFRSELRKSEGRVFFAGSDLEHGWAGFMDGAIESGKKTAETVNAFVSERA